jgi:hypothetical protein
MTSETPDTIRAWLVQQGAADVPCHHMARALGVGLAEVETLLQVAPTAEGLLNINTLAQYRHLALAHRVWPHCTWLEWPNEQPPHPVIHLIRDTFGLSLMKYVQQTFGDEIVLRYWSDLEVPPTYADIVLNYDEGDPLDDVPDEQIVSNPHQGDDEVGQVFIFGSPATAACFLWLIESRYNYSHYVDQRTGYLSDPMGIRLAYDLREVVKDEYWAALPPDTLPAYLAIARGLYEAIVPDDYQEGRLPALRIIRTAELTTNRLAVVQMGGDQLWLDPHDELVFEQAPIRAFVLDPECDRSPAALILTTRDEPGNPEQHRQGTPYRYLESSFDTLILALVPSTEVDLDDTEQVIHETLNDTSYGTHAQTGTFCICRANPLFGEAADGFVPVYRIPGGYMLQFNSEYHFTPQEMAED